jgi:NAD(P)-dependent dehydrogenase (short-subunit alcohol dehydrogenase family)
MRTAVVTGGGSGVGRAIALKLAQQGCRVVIIGRREEALRETIRLAGRDSPRFKLQVCDVGNPAAVSVAGQAILAEFGEVEILVNAAATNVPRRALSVLSPEDYHEMIRRQFEWRLLLRSGFSAPDAAV